jgi:fused signal recognition particle receptor
MSKFFKWLKKDKQQEESPNVSDAASDEVVNQQQDSALEQAQEELKNNSSNTTEAVTETQSDKSSDGTIDDNEVDVSSRIPEHNEGVKLTKETDYSFTETVKTADSDHKLSDDPETLPVIDAESDVSDQTKLQEPKSSSIPQASAEISSEGFFSKLKRGLSRTKESIGSGIVGLFRDKAIDDELFEELETQLLVADVGMNTTVKIINKLTESSNRKQLKDGNALYQLLKEQMAELLHKVESPLTLKSNDGPFVILMVGVNGVGKTTTIGKMAKQFQQQGKKVMLAAGDTFRAAAVEQLQVWGERNNIPVVAQQTGSDSASVIFDAFQSAKARNIDVLIADTAGRLQNKDHLMEELKKVVRVMKKISPDAPHEIMLTLDAGTGQNAVSQTKLFHEAVGLTGISLTKLDGTAKGGVIFAIADQFDIPIRYVGIGEGIDDLRPFNSQDFVNALFAESEGQQPKTN